ncbi:hypothetical protein NLX86_29335 [Streptomyces sp. A3M-1-3]|uniref:hypothetical protein n=1 Tax=Streptomyces sp. A3M-1-3 TaxID=2962044 RepID=UPI0020B765F6|nr:hypothetical protein [Streptomyces sp. A3M-1-3]MCP3822040.1 hypothetical protein [Streptomyces sp. A3M-1-3]
MAVDQLSAAPHAPAHPLANPGYGKRNAPDQRPHRADDFAHLPRREAAIAAYIDRLPEGADISVKTLAKVLPDYGQCAVRTALRRLSEAGHMRWGKEHLTDTTGSPRWVTRTFFSRTARDDAWWAAFTTGNVPQEQPPPHQERPPRTRAYAVLASLGRTEPAMTLSAADCTALEPLAAEWLARGATEAELLHALTAGLPVPVHHPAGIARARLTTKLPPHRPQPAPTPQRPAPLRTLECTECRAPGRPEALAGGLCRTCRREAPPATTGGLTPAEVQAHATRVRTAARIPEGTRT